MLVCFTMILSFASCGKEESTNTDGKITFTMEVSKDEIEKGKDISVFGHVTGSENTGYDITLKNVGDSNGADYIDVTGNGTVFTLSVNKNVAEEMKFIVEGRPDANTKLSQSKTITIKPNVTGEVTIDANVVSSKSGAQKTFIRKGDDVELNVKLTTKNSDKSYTVDVVNPSDMDDLVTIDKTTNKITVSRDVEENKTVTITVTSNANPAAKKSFEITVRPPRKAGNVGNLTQATLDKLGSLKLAVVGTLKDIETRNKQTTTKTYEFKTYLDADGEKQEQKGIYNDYVFSEASWYSEWNVAGNSDNVLSNTYVRGDDGLVKKKFVNKNNVVDTETVTDSYGNELTWDSQRYWNHLGYLELSQFVQDETNENLYIYDMEYGTTDYDILTGSTTYTPTEDEYLMKFLSWSLTPMLDVQFYKFSIELDANGNVSKLIGETYQTNLYTTDEEGNREVTGYYLSEVEMSVLAYGDNVSLPEIKPYEAPASGKPAENFGYLKNAIDSLAKVDTNSYSFKMKETQTYTPAYDPDDYNVSGEDVPKYDDKTSTSTAWDGKVHTKNFVSDTGDLGYMGIVTPQGVLINSTGAYSNEGGGYHTEVTGYKQNSDNTYEYFEYYGGKLVGKSRKDGNVSSRLPKFDVSPYIFNFSGMTAYRENTSTEWIYSYSLRDAVIIRSVAEEFCIKDYARYATGDLAKSFSVNVYVNWNTNETRLLGVSFAYNINDSYYGYYHTEFSNFGTAKLPDDLFSSANYVVKEKPQSWSYFTNSEYYANSNMKMGDGETMTAENLINKVFGKNASGVNAADSLPSPKVFSDLFYDNFSLQIFHNYFNSRDRGSDGEYIYRPSVSFNVWVDSIELDAHNALTLSKYNAIMDKLSAELEKVGFTNYEQGYILKEGTTGKTRQRCYINDEAGDRGMIIRVENIGYKTFYVTMYNKGDWSPTK